MVTITKEFHFSAGHILDRLPSRHPCACLHGHNCIVALELSAHREALTEAGFVRDYRDLGEFKEWMDDTLDHHLNEAIEEGFPPTAENLATWIFGLWTERFPELTAVRVYETPKTWAQYRPAR